MRPRPWQILLFALVLALGFRLWQKNQQQPSDAASAPSSDPSPKATAAGTASSPLWRVGSSQTYLLQTRRVLHMKGRGPDTQSDDYPLSVSATLSTLVLRADPLIVTQLARLSDLRIDLSGDADAKQKLQAALSHPIVLVYEPSGKLRALRCHRDVDTVGRGFAKALFASIQYVRSPEKSPLWQSQELDATGEYEASYKETPPGLRVHKQRAKYLQARTAQGLMPIGQLGKVEGALSLDFVLDAGDDEAARIVSVEGRDNLVVDPGPDMPLVSSESTIKLVRSQSSTAEVPKDALALLDSPDYTLSPLALMDASDSDRRGDEQKVAGRSFADLLQALRDIPASDTGSQRAELQMQLSARFRLSPETPQKAAQAIAQGLPAPMAKTILGALSGAQSEKGQAALIDVLKNRKLSTDLREHAVAVLGLSEAPSDDTAQALQAAMHDADPGVRGTAALALGNVASAARQAGQLGAAETQVDQLIDLYQAAKTDGERADALEALGNTGDPRILPIIQGALASQDVEVRVSATRALRFIVAASVDALIAQVMQQDPAPTVRKAALMACSFRQLVAFFPALQKTVQSDLVPDVRQDALSLLAKMKDQPGVVQLIRTVAERDPDPQLRKNASDLLR
ncbi:MAG TPA: HEAT repeat domain-containing protein [Pseudomonadota bacterium]|nr:HEAT repeat domain-containing protein [Pseudomonadota bacterium]HNN50845.1 HEAT repeat domain-containing protein [Pseudomonadota bacterium]